METRFSSQSLQPPAIMWLWLLLSLPWTINANKWCDTRLCEQGRLHILCKDQGRFYSTCSAASELVQMTKNDMEMITHIHNDLRNKVAGGFTALPRAARMLTMQWDVDLAKVAEAAVRMCQLEKLLCATTPLFLWTGQNEALESSDCIQPSNILLRKQLESWTSQLNNALPQHLQDPSAG
ncbi:antigen 5 like allergen Cul n 1-like isoform X2 [Drosophila subobscura]|nr:antigen 5 like allergen Cul n 1-like isoform X2 [Drosophila subobscura]